MQILMMLRNNEKKKSHGWVIPTSFFLLAVIFVGLFANNDFIEYLNNKNPKYCNRYADYLDMNATHQCIAKCWRLYGCDQDAIGTRFNCTCGNIDISDFKQWYHNGFYNDMILPNNSEQQITGIINKDVNTVGIGPNGEKLEVRLD
jgi:hypothetical protein